MKLYSADNCPSCNQLKDYMDNNNIEVTTEKLQLGSVAKQNLPFTTVPSLVLEDGSVISGFPQIRLYFAKEVL